MSSTNAPANLLTHQQKTKLRFALPILLAAACLPSAAQMTSVGIDCAQVHAQGVDKQENFRAGKAMIECGFLPGGTPSDESSTAAEPATPIVLTNVLVSNRSCTSSSTCTKSESMVWADSANGGQTVVDNYNDHNPTYNSFSGTSYSTNGGVTFTEILPPPFATGHGNNLGDPIVVFNAKLNEWFAGDLVSGGNCGAQGIGLWTSTNGQAWSTGSCPHVGTQDDRESMWVDNEPTSGVYGRMYISFNDFANNNGALSVVHSDDGVSWSAPVIVDSSFIRDVQLTGSPVGAARYEGSNSTVFLATMDEGGGGFNTRQNDIYKSLDGGVTWTVTTTGPRFAPPGSLTCGYFAVVAPIWRHMGWGQPGVGPTGVVHYAYAGAGTNGDVGDIYYVRSTDNGRTWSTPIELNTDVDNSFHTQWMPSLSADKNGNVTVSWYDRRAATSSCSAATDPGCSYERVGRQSNNNGVTFGPEVTISTALIPQPTQNDPSVVSCYAGDYDYDMSLNGDAYDSWTDGRRSVGGVQVQDVEFGLALPTTTNLLLNYYDQADPGFTVDDIHVSNPNSSATDATLELDSLDGQTLSIAAEGDSYGSFPARTGGPVLIIGDVPLTASRRTFYYNSFAEVYAQSSGAASTSLLLNWYDQQTTGFSLVDIHLANPNNSSVSATVKFGANTKTVTVPANGIAVVNFPGQKGGPVFITATGPILASSRTEYFQSFNEVNAVPTSQASTKLEFGWYDQTAGFTLDNIHISNPSSSTATVTVSLAGVVKQTVTIATNSEAVVNLGAVLGGPVTITSTVPVIASQRAVYNQSFNEVFAVPSTLASANLILNWYDQDNISFKTDNVHLVNPSTTVSSTVTVKVGSSSSTVTIAPGGGAHVGFSGVVGGPVFITATSPVTASARTTYNSSFNEVNAVPVP